jgi:hypothetical protein
MDVITPKLQRQLEELALKLFRKENRTLSMVDHMQWDTLDKGMQERYMRLAVYRISRQVMGIGT